MNTHNGRCHVMTGRETGVMHLQAMTTKEWLRNARRLEEVRKGSPLEP